MSTGYIRQFAPGVVVPYDSALFRPGTVAANGGCSLGCDHLPSYAVIDEGGRWLAICMYHQRRSTRWNKGLRDPCVACPWTGEAA